jgi:hypothetical protein
MGWGDFLAKLNKAFNLYVRKKDDGLDYITFEAGSPSGKDAVISLYLETAERDGLNRQALISGLRWLLGEAKVKVLNQKRDLQGNEAFKLTGISQLRQPDEHKNVQNTWMKQALDNGTAVDVRQVGVEIEPGVFQIDEVIPGVTYVDSKTEKHIVSIGQDKETGVIYASIGDEYYHNPDYECLYLQ